MMGTHISTPSSRIVAPISSKERRFLANDSEFAFLTSLAQGHLIDPEAWAALVTNYGFCEQHAWLHIGVETTFRRRHLLGPAILYRTLIERSLRAFQSLHFGPIAVAHDLRSSGHCPLCVALMADEATALPHARLEEVRDCSHLINLAYDTEPLWRKFVCPQCAHIDDQDGTGWSCRRHLIRQIEKKRQFDLGGQEAMLKMMLPHLIHFEHSFDSGNSSPSNPDRAAFVTAIGWMSGWRPLLDLLS